MLKGDSTVQTTRALRFEYLSGLLWQKSLRESFMIGYPVINLDFDLFISRSLPYSMPLTTRHST